MALPPLSQVPWRWHEYHSVRYPGGGTNTTQSGTLEVARLPLSQVSWRWHEHHSVRNPGSGMVTTQSGTLEVAWLPLSQVPWRWHSYHSVRYPGGGTVTTQSGTLFRAHLALISVGGVSWSFFVCGNSQRKMITPTEVKTKLFLACTFCTHSHAMLNCASHSDRYLIAPKTVMRKRTRMSDKQQVEVKTLTLIKTIVKLYSWKRKKDCSPPLVLGGRIL